MIIVLLGRMMILYNSDWTIFKITAFLSAPYNTIFLPALPPESRVEVENSSSPKIKTINN
jgi:hypothetical protein